MLVNVLCSWRKRREKIRREKEKEGKEKEEESKVNASYTAKVKERQSWAP